MPDHDGYVAPDGAHMIVDHKTEQDPPVRKPNRAERRAMIYGNAALGFPSGREPRSTTRARRITLRQNADAPANVARKARAARVKARREAGRIDRNERNAARS